MSMPSNHLNRPPGLSAHNVKVEVDDYKHVSELDEVIETIDEIPVTSMHLASHSISQIVEVFISHDELVLMTLLQNRPCMS